MSGRRASTQYGALNYQLLRENKRTYVKCNFCDRSLQNTSMKRLLAHRSNCGMDGFRRSAIQPASYNDDVEFVELEDTVDMSKVKVELGSDSEAMPSSSGTNIAKDSTSANTFSAPGRYAQAARRTNLSYLSRMYAKTHAMRSAPVAKTQPRDWGAEEHEFDIFGKLIAKQLRALPFKEALETQEFFTVYLNKIRLRNLEKATPLNLQNTTDSNQLDDHSYFEGSTIQDSPSTSQ